MSVTTAVADEETRVVNKVKRYLFLYMFLGQIFYQFDRSNIGLANLTMGKDLGLTAEAFGFASSIFSLSAFLMQVPAGKAFDTFGARRWLTAIMVCWGLVVVGEGFVTNGTQLATLRFFVGFFEAGYLPGLYILMSRWLRGRHQGAAMATLVTASACSNIVGGPFSGWVLSRHFLGMAGWRGLFVIDGALTAVWALLSLFILYDGPEQATWLKPDEKAFLARYLAQADAEKKVKGSLEVGGLWDTLKNRNVFGLLLAFACSGWISSTFTFFIPTLLKRASAGASVQTVGFLVMGPYIVYAVVAQLWARHADRTERHWHLLIPLVVSGIGILLYPVAKSPIVAMLTVCLIQAGTAGFYVNFWPTANMVVGRTMIAKSTALINSGMLMLSFLGPIYFGWALDKTGNTNLGLYTAVGVLAVNFLLMHIFFVQYKARQKNLARGAAVSAE